MSVVNTISRTPGTAISKSRALITRIYNRRPAATFSTRSHGLQYHWCKNISLDQHMSEREARGAWREYISDYPFNDPKAHNCMVVFEVRNSVSTISRRVPQIQRMRHLHSIAWEAKASILEREIGKLVEKAGFKVCCVLQAYIYSPLYTTLTICRPDGRSLRSLMGTLCRSKSFYSSSSRTLFAQAFSRQGWRERSCPALGYSSESSHLL